MQEEANQIRTNHPGVFFAFAGKVPALPAVPALLVAAMLFSFAATAQKLKQSDYDEAKKQWHIESFPVALKTAPGVKMEVALASTDSMPLVLRLTGLGAGTGTVISGDNLIFLLDDDSTVTAKSPTVQDVPRGSTAYSFDYVLKPDDLRVLSRHNLQAVRKYSTDGYDDVYMESGNTGKLKEVSALFLDELVKRTVLPSKPAVLQAGFPGGSGVLLNFLNRNLKTVPAIEAGERRYSQVQFNVRPDGTVSEARVAHSAGEAFDKELMRIWRRMPKWKPAVEGGEKVETTVMQPLTFVQTGNGVQVMF